MDNLTPEQRKKNMQNIRYKDTLPEGKVMKELRRKKIYFAKHVTSIYGKPDIVFRRKKVVVFIDSCFWHKCPYHYIEPKSNKSYWVPKIERNKERAKEVNRKLKKEGWQVIRIWEHSIKKDINGCINKIIRYL